MAESLQISQIFSYLSFSSPKYLVTAILTFWTFAIAKFETSKFLICINETNILESSFKSTESETKSQQSTSKLHKSLVLYH